MKARRIAVDQNKLVIIAGPDIPDAANANDDSIKLNLQEAQKYSSKCSQPAYFEDELFFNFISYPESRAKEGYFCLISLGGNK
jgi:hypothetical protein